MDWIPPRSIPDDIQKKKSTFRFTNHVAEKEEFLEILKSVWQKDIKGCKMYRVVQKMKMLKKPLRNLSWKNGDLFEKVQELKKSLEQVQSKLDTDPFNNDLKGKVVQLGKYYAEAAEDELKLLHQKAKINWLKEGDKNYAYFHSILRTSKNKSRIYTICKEDRSRIDGEKVSQQFVDHFNNFLGQGHPVMPLNNLDKYVQAKISNEDDIAMVTMVTYKEIKDAILDIDSSKAACGSRWVHFLLLQKSMKLYWPITCCNVLYKCISKILTNRIKDGLSKVISLNQSAFIPGRHIQDNILISQELLNGYNRKNGAKRCVMKIDIQKAYDTVNWDFLRNALVLMCGFFKGGRGLRQGDPMLALLFCKAGILHVRILNKRTKSKAKRTKSSTGMDRVRKTEAEGIDTLNGPTRFPILIGQGKFPLNHSPHKGLLEACHLTHDASNDVNGMTRWQSYAIRLDDGTWTRFKGSDEW
ncbi:RNA-directed DNA polymerase, eukaryota, reverse transcriptase zinc-binding domain protein [Tanacetum coccineum]